MFTLKLSLRILTSRFALINSIYIWRSGSCSYTPVITEGAVMVSVVAEKALLLQKSIIMTVDVKVNT